MCNHQYTEMHWQQTATRVTHGSGGAPPGADDLLFDENTKVPEDEDLHTGVL